MRSVLMVSLLAVAVGCGGDATSPASASINGTYSLKSMNGSSLPFTFQRGNNPITLTSDVLTIADSTWSEVESYGQPVTEIVADGGPWSRAGTAIRLSSKYTSGYSGTFTGSSLNLSDLSFAYVFVR